MTGVNIVTFYSTSIFQTDFHYSGTTSRIISACLQVWQFVCAGLAVLIIDKLGRRKLLIMAATGNGNLPSMLGWSVVRPEQQICRRSGVLLLLHGSVFLPLSVSS